MDQRALSIRETKLGPDHPDTATSLNNLAALLQAEGKHAEAEPLYRRALEIRETKLGPDHPDTATSLGNLGLVVQELGKRSEAERLMQEAWSTLERTLGSSSHLTNHFLKFYLATLRINGRSTAYRSVLSQLESTRAELLRRRVDVILKLDKRRRR